MEMKRLIKVAWYTPTHRGWGLPIAFRASPGMSKTAQIRQIAAECGLPCEILSPGERGEGAFGVVPVPKDDLLTYPAPNWISKFTTPEKGQDLKKFTPRGVVFVDELTTCFAAGTLVTLENGKEKPIEEIEAGMRVLSYARTLQGGTCRGNVVKRVIKHQPKMTYRVIDENGNATECTEDHLFFTKWGWTPAEKLVGQEVCVLSNLSQTTEGNHKYPPETSPNDDGRVSTEISINQATIQGNGSLSNRATSRTYHASNNKNDRNVESGGNTYQPRAHIALNRRAREISRKSCENIQTPILKGTAQCKCKEGERSSVQSTSGSCVPRRQGGSKLAPITEGARACFKKVTALLGKRDNGWCSSKESTSGDRGQNSAYSSQQQTNSKREALYSTYQGAELTSPLCWGRLTSCENSAGQSQSLEKPGFHKYEKLGPCCSSRRPNTRHTDQTSRNSRLHSRGVSSNANHCTKNEYKHPSTQTISWRRIIRIEFSAEQPVYDITVARDHCFFANGNLVHNCPPALQPPLLGLFLEGRIGGTELPPGVRCIAAYNDVDEAAAGYDLPPPLANRMGHIPFDPGGTEEWTDWLVGANGIGSHFKQTVDSEAEEARVLSAWPDAFALAKGKAIAFLRTRPALLHKMPPPHDPAASKAWPSRRTWEFAVRALASCAIHGAEEDVETQLIAAFVGDAIAGELYTYLRDEDLPDPAEILDGNIEFTHDKKRLDRSFAILAACTALVVPENAKKRDARGKHLWEIITKIAKDGAKDVVFGAAQRLARTGHLSHIEARPALAMLQGVMEAAKIGGR